MGKMKKRAKKALKQAKALSLKALNCARSAGQTLMSHKVATLHTLMLGWLTFRIEQIHATVYGLLNIIIYIGFQISADLQSARDQFEAAIRSILTLFGGDGA